MWNQKKLVQMISFAKQKQRHRHREQMYGYQGGKGVGGRNWEIEIDIYTLLILCIKQITNEPTVQHRELYSVLCGDLNGKEIQKGGDICIRIADSLCRTAETNTKL